jgi:hypothetical protein
MTMTKGKHEREMWKEKEFSATTFSRFFSLTKGTKKLTETKLSSWFQSYICRHLVFILSSLIVLNGFFVNVKGVESKSAHYNLLPKHNTLNGTVLCGSPAIRPQITVSEKHWLASKALSERSKLHEEKSPFNTTTLRSAEAFFLVT